MGGRLLFQMKKRQLNLDFLDNALKKGYLWTLTGHKKVAFLRKLDGVDTTIVSQKVFSVKVSGPGQPFLEQFVPDN